MEDRDLGIPNQLSSKVVQAWRRQASTPSEMEYAVGRQKPSSWITIFLFVKSQEEHCQNPTSISQRTPHRYAWSPLYLTD